MSPLSLSPALAYLPGQANAIGRSSKTVREFLEKAWKADMTQDESIKLAVKSLLEVVQTGAKNIDLAVMEGFGQVRVSPPFYPPTAFPPRSFLPQRSRETD